MYHIYGKVIKEGKREKREEKEKEGKRKRKEEESSNPFHAKAYTV